MTLFSYLISLATTSSNHWQEPYSTSFAPFLRSIQDLQTNKALYSQKRKLLVYNLYLSLSPKDRGVNFLSFLPLITLSKLSQPEIYSPPNHWIHESEDILALWEDHLLHGRQPDRRLKRHPLLKLEEGQLKLDLAGNQSTIIQDEATGEIVAMVYRNFMPGQYHSILEWINHTIMTSINRKRSARVSLYPILIPVIGIILISKLYYS